MSEQARLRLRPEPERPPVVTGNYDFGGVTDKIGDIILRPMRRTSIGWYLGLIAAFGLVNVLMLAVGYLFLRGIGVWGTMIPVGWGIAITNFVWWIGIGHAGTLISAILLLFRQEWRTSINRFAEAMTLFAVANAGLFPILHLGRFWLFYWLVPYPNTMGAWPNFRSPLVWDVFAITTYITISAVFWYVGMVPDLAALRDKATHRLVRPVFGILSLGWRGSARHWQRYERAYFLLAALATPLVVSVHSVVSLDFTAAQVPGWHSTIFPPYFVAGAIFSGFAMVLTIAIPLRAAYGLKDFITERHLDNMARVMLATGLIVAYGYMMEWFMAWYSGSEFEGYIASFRLFGAYGWVTWLMLTCNVLVPQLLWFKPFRTVPVLLFIVSILVNVGMWTERFVIVITSTSRDFLPSSWGFYLPTRVDWATFIGTIGLFVFLIFLFIRFLPVISITEMRDLLVRRREDEERERRLREEVESS